MKCFPFQFSSIHHLHSLSIHQSINVALAHEQIVRADWSQAIRRSSPKQYTYDIALFHWRTKTVIATCSAEKTPPPAHRRRGPSPPERISANASFPDRVVDQVGIPENSAEVRGPVFEPRVAGEVVIMSRSHGSEGHYQAASCQRLAKSQDSALSVDVLVVEREGFVLAYLAPDVSDDAVFVLCSCEAAKGEVGFVQEPGEALDHVDLETFDLQDFLVGENLQARL